MAHSRVLQGVLETPCDVLPMRFGVVMPDAATVRDELLAPHAAELAAQLATVAGKVELDGAITCPEEVILRAVVAGDRQLADLARHPRRYHERLAAGGAVAASVGRLLPAVSAPGPYAAVPLA